MRLAIFALAAACGMSPQFPGTYALVAYAKPGEHEAGRVPRELRGMTLILRDDGSATIPPNEGEYFVNTEEHSALITSGGGEAFRARFSHDTLVTRVPGGGPSLYWMKTK